MYHILERTQRIVHRTPRAPQPDLPREAPLHCWPIDFKDVSTVVDDPGEPTGKKHRGAEAFTIVDEGTSILLLSQVRTDFTAETLLGTLAQAIHRYGTPRCITLDRDPRSVGTPHGGDFPSALVRVGASLGLEMQVCAPRHPQENGCVERSHRSYQEECLSIERPKTLEQARVATAVWTEHSDRERPNQARSCENRPPFTAFPAFPSLPRPPEEMDADGWLGGVDGFHVERKVDTHGNVHVDLRRYSVDVHRAGQRITLGIQVASHSLLVWHEGILRKHVPSEGAGQGTLFLRALCRVHG